MTYVFAYEPASWDTPAQGCRPGALALLDYVHSIGFGDVGCFNDRAITGTTDVPSVHREGRAVDITEGNRPVGDLDELTEVLAGNYAALGVQLVIYNGREWSVTTAAWRFYDGPAGPHADHAHVELCREAAEANTVELYRDTLRYGIGPIDDSEGDIDMASAQPTLYRPHGYANVFAIFATGEVIHCDTKLVELYGGTVETGEAENMQTLHSLLRKAGCDASDAVRLDAEQ